MKNNSLSLAVKIGMLAVTGLVLGGCAKDMSDLENYVQSVKSKSGGIIEPLPEIKRYESYSYTGENLRSPFEPERAVRAAAATGSGLQPDLNRNREFLEDFPLDALRMVGTMSLSGVNTALIQDTNGLIHRVQPGNYVGQNDGRITSISPSDIKINEIVSDTAGGYVEREAAISLSE